MIRVNRFCVLFLILILTACGGSSDSSENIIVDPPEAPQDGIQGGTASRINGAQISVQDASGNEVVVASGRNTNQNGRYRLVFSEFEIQEGINPPLVLTLDGSGATAVCDYDQEGDNDCLTREGNFVAYGATYSLPDGFSLRALAPTYPPASDTGDRLVSVNFSAASDLAANLAMEASGGSDLTQSMVELANQQALGVVEFTTGLTTSGQDINTITNQDLTTTEPGDTAALALALFSASIHGQVDTEVAALSDYRRILDRLGAQIQITETENVRARGDYLSEVLTAYVSGASNYQTSLSVPSAELAGGLASRQISIPLLEQTGSGLVNIAVPADPGSDDALDRGRTLINRLSEVMGSTLLISSTTAFGGTSAGASLVYSDLIALMETLVSQELRSTVLLLDNAITEAVANGETTLTGTNVSGVLEVSGDTVTLTTVTATTSNIQTGVSVNLSIATGTRTNPGLAGTFEAPEITISVSRTQDELTTQQLFTGALTLQMNNDGSATDVSAINYVGDLRATSNLEFTGDISLTSLSASGSNISAGAYDANFNFADGSSLSLSGRLETQIDSYTVVSGDSTVMVDLVTNTITDMNAALNLDLDTDGLVTGGSVIAVEEAVGNMSASGIVEFVDETATSLPAPVI